MGDTGTGDMGTDTGLAGAPRGASRVAIVGAGSVGATIAYACLIRGVASTVALYDLDADKTTAEVLDLEQGIQFVPMAQVVGSDDVAVTAGSPTSSWSPPAPSRSPARPGWSWPGSTSRCAASSSRSWSSCRPTRSSCW